MKRPRELGAAGCMIVHETVPAGYPWEVVRDSWSGEQFDLVGAADKKCTRGRRRMDHARTGAALFRAAGSISKR